LLSKSRSEFQVRNNLIHDNEYHCGPESSYFDYCRPLGADAQRIGGVTGNVFLRNRIHDFSVRSQINGDHNYVIGNICYRARNSDAKSFPTGQCFGIQPYGISAYNVFANNTMFDTDDAAILFAPNKTGLATMHTIVNNVMQNCAADAPKGRKNSCIYVPDDTSIGSQVISHNLVYNDWGPASILYKGRNLATAAIPATSEKVPNIGEGGLQYNWNADPLLRGTLTGDFSLSESSPAVQRGIEVPLPRQGVSFNHHDLGAIPFRPNVR
jgi:hypothetical protein